MKPAGCASLADVRAEIDRIDAQIVTLIGERQRYVQVAAQFKTSETSVRAPERFAAMLSARRSWAEEHGVNPDIVEKLFRDLVEHFIREELAQWKASNV